MLPGLRFKEKRSNMWGAIIGAAGSILGGKAAGSAGDAAADATNNASAAQERMFNKQVELQSPFRATGLQAQNQLNRLLGLTQVETPEQVRKRLLDEYTSIVTTPGYSPSRTERLVNSLDPFNIFGKSGRNVEANVTDALNIFGHHNVDPKNLSVTDEAKLQEAIAAEIARQQADVSSSDYGSLLKDFSMADFEADPSYAFRQQEGLKGIEGGAAARGGLLSGGALKAIQKYGQDLASNEYGNAYGRYTANQTNKYNKLAGLVNSAQGATNQLTNAAGNLGTQLGANAIGAGNAQAASIIGQANAITGGLSQGYNAYQNNQLMNLIRKPGTSYSSNTPTVESYYGY